MREFLGLGPAPDAAAAQRGAPVFKANCSGCHGDDARGKTAPDLVRSLVVLHDDNDETIAPLLKSGRPGTAMPAFASLSAEQVHDVAQFLKLQVENAANRGRYTQLYGQLRNQLSGDPKRGESFFSANCASCHSVTGDLSKIGAKFAQPSQLQTRFLWPVDYSKPVKATVTLATGEKIDGVIRHMDDFNVTLTDAAGAERTFARTAAKVQVEDAMKAHRALLPKYTDADIHNLTAYLAGIK